MQSIESFHSRSPEKVGLRGSLLGERGRISFETISHGLCYISVLRQLHVKFRPSLRSLKAGGRPCRSFRSVQCVRVLSELQSQIHDGDYSTCCSKEFSKCPNCIPIHVVHPIIIIEPRISYSGRHVSFASLDETARAVVAAAPDSCSLPPQTSSCGPDLSYVEDSGGVFPPSTGAGP